MVGRTKKGGDCCVRDFAISLNFPLLSKIDATTTTLAYEEERGGGRRRRAAEAAEAAVMTIAAVAAALSPFIHVS